MTPEATAGALVGLRRMNGSFPRPASLGELEIGVASKDPIDQAAAARYAGPGVERLIL